MRPRSLARVRHPRNQPAVNLAKLLADYAQFVTQEKDLRLRSVLFPVQDLPVWVKGGGVFSAIILRAFRTLVLGKLFHSHAAERMVHLGSTMRIRGATGELKDRVAPKV